MDRVISDVRERRIREVQFAHRLEREGYVLLSFDGKAWRRGYRYLPGRRCASVRGQRLWPVRRWQ